MKKFWAGLVALALSLGLFASPALAQKRLVCTTFPVWLFTVNILQNTDAFRARLMIDSQLGCPHDYALTPADLEAVSLADVLVINGLGLEDFMAQALKVAKPDVTVIDCSKGLPAIPAGLNPEEPGGGGPHPAGLNPHIFASPALAQGMVANIAAGLAELDPGGAEIYRKNAEDFSKSLAQVDLAFKSAGTQLGRPKVIAGHGVFDYMAKELDLEVVGDVEPADGAAPSAAHMAELIKIAASHKVAAILIDPQGNRQLAATLGAETGLPVAVIDPVASGPADAPLDYYQKVMARDLNILISLFTAPPPPAPKTPGKKK